MILPGIGDRIAPSPATLPAAPTARHGDNCQTEPLSATSMADAGSSVPGPWSATSTRLPSSRKGAVRTSGALSRKPAWSERGTIAIAALVSACGDGSGRSEEHTSELQSLMRISYAVFCLKKKKTEY